MSTLSISPAFQSTTVRPARANRSSVRLTRRGRLVVFLTALTFVLAAAVFLAQGAMGTDEQGTPVPTEIVMVGSGDTLWGIASEAAGDGDVRQMMTQIRHLNALDSGLVQAGQKLRVPLAQG